MIRQLTVVNCISQEFCTHISYNNIYVQNDSFTGITLQGKPCYINYFVTLTFIRLD